MRVKKFRNVQALRRVIWVILTSFLISGCAAKTANEYRLETSLPGNCSCGGPALDSQGNVWLTDANLAGRLGSGVFYWSTARHKMLIPTGAKIKGTTNVIYDAKNIWYTGSMDD